MLCPPASPSLCECSTFQWLVPQFPCVTGAAPLSLPALGVMGLWEGQCPPLFALEPTAKECCEGCTRAVRPRLCLGG